MISILYEENGKWTPKLKRPEQAKPNARSDQPKPKARGKVIPILVYERAQGRGSAYVTQGGQSHRRP